MRGDPGARALIKGMSEVFRHGWGADNPEFKDIYTASFVPGGNDEQRRWFHDPDRVKTLGGGDGGLCHHDLPRSHVVRRFGAGSPAEEAPGLRGSMWGA